MKKLTKFLTVMAFVVLCVSLFTLTAFAEHTSGAECKAYMDANSISAAEDHTSEAVAPTCSTDGKKGYYLCPDPECSRCYDGPDPSIANYLTSLVDPATGIHTIDATADKVAEVPADCSTEGTKEHYKCSVCQNLFLDAAGKNPVTEADLKIPKNGQHVPGASIAEKKATCKEDGNIAYRVCSKCGGYCDDSGNTLGSVTISKDTVAHDWDAWVVTKAATAASSGSQQRSCKICGKIETEIIPATGIPAATQNIFPVIAERDTYYRGEAAPLFRSDLIKLLNDQSGAKANFVGVRIGTDKSMYANSYDTLDFWSWDQYIELGEDMLRNLDAGTYYIWVYNKNNPDQHTDSRAFYVIDTPTLDPINTDKHVVNSTKNLRFRASEPVQPGSVKVGGKTLWDENYYYVSNDGLTITLSPDFLNDRQVGTYTISANTVSDGTKVSCPFYILSTAGASASPKTGDESQIGLWAALILLSGAAIVVLVPKIRKHGA